MAAPSDALRKLQDYFQKLKGAEKSSPSPEDRSAYASQLEIAFGELTHQVKEEQKTLEQLQANNPKSDLDEPSTDPRLRLKQLQIIKAAYEHLSQAPPNLPSPESPLPTLLALRHTHQVLSESRESAENLYQKLVEARRELSQEQADLRDAQLITTALQDRIAKLNIEVQEKSQKTPEEAAEALIAVQEQRRQSLEQDTRKLVKALARFIKSHLAAPLAAEELGGPVVGDLLDISDEMLAAGFNQRGKAKKPKARDSDSDIERQMRIDQIWGLQEEAINDGTEREAAATEMRLLTEDLLNVAAEKGSAAYVTLTRESAAARFLVRAKAAQFHPRDARKLRLIDFGRELDE